MNISTNMNISKTKENFQKSLLNKLITKYNIDINPSTISKFNIDLKNIIPISVKQIKINDIIYYIDNKNIVYKCSNNIYNNITNKIGYLKGSQI